MHKKKKSVFDAVRADWRNLNCPETLSRGGELQTEPLIVLLIAVLSVSVHFPVFF